MLRPTYLQCNVCVHHQPHKPFNAVIRKTRGIRWKEANYNLQNFKREILRDLPNRPPNLCITLVEELHSAPRPQVIPFVIVSATDNMDEERKGLDAHIKVLTYMGSLQPRKFIDQMIHVIEEKTGK